MISVAEARARILAALTPVAAEILGLEAAFGRVLAAPLQARLTQPPADMSAMDGYAVRAAEAQAGADLRLIGEAPAGRPFARALEAGETVRIFTGSVMPAGADSVLLQEDAVARDGGIVRVQENCQPGRHIRRQGQDFMAGDALLPAGRRLSARDLGLAAAANHPWLGVRRKPQVALLCTGDEIALPGEALGPGGVVNSNAAMLAALVAQYGGTVRLLPPARDDASAIAAGVAAAYGADLLVTTGGASVGAHDLVQAGLAAHDFALDFWKIAMRPGKPLIFGQAGALPVLGLPGNPVSAFVCAQLFLRPALARLAGADDAALPVFETARLGAALGPAGSREEFLRADLIWADGAWVATALPVQDSAMLSALARAGALIRRPVGAPSLAAGAAVEIIRL